MDPNYEDRDKAQIIRQDAKNCFVESKNDAFDIGKAHLEFATYDISKPKGQRQTNHVHIYITMPEFLCLAQEALSGMLLSRARQMKEADAKGALYESLGGTSAEKLKQYGRPRPDGKSLSRIVKLINARKDDHYLFVADSGPGETDAKGLIVPKFGNNPENHVAVSMSWRAFNELMLMTQTHYGAWLAAKYTIESSQNTQNTQKSQNAQNVNQSACQDKTPQDTAQTMPARQSAAPQKAAQNGTKADKFTEMQMF